MGRDNDCNAWYQLAYIMSELYTYIYTYIAIKYI